MFYDAERNRYIFAGVGWEETMITGSYPSSDSDSDLEFLAEYLVRVRVYDAEFFAISCKELYDDVCEKFTWNVETFSLYAGGRILPYADEAMVRDYILRDSSIVDVVFRDRHYDYAETVSLQSTPLVERDPVLTKKLREIITEFEHQRLPLRYRVREQSAPVREMFAKFETQMFSIRGKTITVNIPLWIESLICLQMQMKNAKTKVDAVNAVGAFMRAITGRSVLASFASRITDFISWCATAVASNEDDMDVPSEDDAEPVEQSSEGFDNPFTSFRSVFTTADKFKESIGARKLHNLFMYLIANSMLDKIGITMDRMSFSEASKRYYAEQYKLGFGFVYSILDGVSFVLEKVYTAYVTRDLGALWHTEAIYEKFADTYEQIKVDALGLCNPDAFDLNYHEFISRVDECLADGRRIVQFVAKRDKPRVQSLLYELEKIRSTELIQRAAARGRRMPFGVLLHGPSGVLKTTLEDILGTHYGRVRELPLGHDYRYTIVPTAEFMSGFTSKMWWMKIDDAAAIKPGVIGDLDPSIRDMLQLFNNAGWCPPQAELELKGKTPCYAEFASLTTNTKTLNANYYFNNDIAIRRRCIFHIDVQVKPEYRIPGASRADTSKIPATPEGAYPNIWELEVQEVYERKEHGESHADLRTIAKFDDIYDFLRFYTERIKRHAYEQDMQRETAAIIKNAVTCDRCYIPKIACQCPEIEEQSLELVEVGAFTAIFIATMLMNMYLQRGFYHRLGNVAAERMLCLATELNAKADVAILNAQHGAVASAAAVRREIVGGIPEMVSVGRQALSDALSDATAAPESVRAVLDAVHTASDRVSSGVYKTGECLKKQLLETLQRAREFHFGPIKQITACIAAGAGMYLLYKHMADQSKPQGATKPESYGQPPPTTDDGEENVWHDSSYKVATLDRGCPPPMSQWDAITTRVQSNTGHVIARNTRDGAIFATRGNVLCIGGQVYVGNAHVLIRDLEEVELTIRFDTNIGMGENVTIVLRRSDFYIDERLDLAYFVVGALPPRKRITQYMPDKKADFGICDGVILHTREDGTREQTQAKAGRCNMRWTSNQWRDIPVWEVKPSIPTVTGDCGSPYIMKTQRGPLLAGIHFAGSTSRSYCMMMCKEDCDKAVNALDHVIVEQGTVVLTDREGMEIELEPLHNKSTVRYISSGQGRAFGSLPGFRPKHVSKVTKTFIHDDVLQTGRPDNFGPPAMRGYGPWRHAIVPIVTQPLLASKSEFDSYADAYLDDILDDLADDWKKEFVILDDRTVVNGHPGCKFVDRLNPHTSMGFPWRKKKIHFLSEVVPPTAPLDVELTFDSEFMIRVGRIREAHLRGEMAHPIFTAHLKDEPRKWKRIATKETRQMSGCPADFLFHTRQYLLMFVRIFQKNSQLFEGAPGINHRSASWDELFHYLTAFGPNQMVAGDFKNYDKGMQATVLMATFRVIYKFALACGWDQIQARVLLCIGYDLAFVYMDFNGDLVQFFGSNSSGHCVTVIVNCIANSLYMRHAYAQQGLDVRTFKRNVHLMTYGDDNIMGISPDVSDRFNHTTIQRSLEEIGVVYTMADKSEESIPLISIWTTTFLKRGWRYDDELGYIVAPIEEDSISKMLTRCIPSDVLCPEAHACDVINNALYEYSLYGRSRFERERSSLLNIVEKRQIWDYFPTEVPTFDECVSRMRREDYQCQCDSTHYRADPEYNFVIEWEKGDRYLVPPRAQPKGNPSSQLLADLPEPMVSSVGDCGTYQGDPQNSYLGMLPVGKQDGSNPPSENGFRGVEVERQPANQISNQVARLEPILIQSEPTTNTAVTSGELVTAENLTFSGGEATAPMVIAGPVSVRDQRNDTDDMASLGKFLSRPVVINQYTWNEDTVFTPTVIYPWHLFFNDTYIKNKLTNYARIRCRLKLKFIINASPFYYGSLRACYFPLDPLTNGRSVFGAAPENLIRFSQAPGVYLEPQSMSTVEMELPFLWEGDWLDTAKADCFKLMGSLATVQFARLLSANDVTGAGVSVKVYAWAENVEIAGLTIGPLLQSDEYEERDGAISNVASSVANVAARAADIPIIGPYARMAEVGADAVSGVAKLFGYSNPPVIEDSKPVTVKSFHALANTDVSVPMDVLAIDPKNELALSSANNGLDGEDELSVVGLCSRESFLAGSTWLSSMASDTPLVTAPVTPGLSAQTLTPTTLFFTPMSYIGEMFKFWRGGIKFKFRFIKTKYHRGRVSITWDPNFNIKSDPDTETTNLTRIVDLENETEVEFVVPYKSAQPYLRTTLNFQTSVSSTPTTTMDKLYDNGVIIMRVQNILTGPSTTPNVTVLMFVSAADDFEYAVPDELNDNLTIWEQSEPVLESEDPQSSKSQITVGEKIASVRSLLHRTSYWSTQTMGSMWDDAGVLYATGWRRTHNLLPKVPLEYGYNPDGCNWTSSPSTAVFQYSKNHPITWILNAFAAYKGSTNVTLNANRGSPIVNASDMSEFSVTRYYGDYLVRPTKQNRNASTDYNNYSAVSSIARSSVITASGAGNPAVSSGRTGMSLTNTRTQAGLQVHVPQYANKRLLVAWGKCRNDGFSDGQDNPENICVSSFWYQNVVSSATAAWPLVDIYYSAGIDFNPIFFVCTPRLVQLSPPTALNSAVPS